MQISEIKGDEKILSRRGPILGLISIVVFFGILVVFAFIHFEDTKRLLALIKHAHTGWMLVAVITQVITYFLAGAVWHIVSRSAKYHLSLKSLIELSVEQLAVNQLIPVGGVAGHVIMVKAMRRLGLPIALAMEVMFVDTLAYHISFSFVTLLSLVILWWHNNMTSIIVSLVTIFFIIELIVVGLTWAAVNHKKLQLPGWLTQGKFTSKLFLAMENISHDRIFSTEMLIQTSVLRLGIFLLDAVSLYALMRAIGSEGNLILAFVALVIASVAGAIVLSPGGIGGFEAGCVAILVLWGTPLGIAIASTLLLRGLSMWIPLIPGLMIAKEDLSFGKK